MTQLLLKSHNIRIILSRGQYDDEVWSVWQHYWNINIKLASSPEL